MEEKKKLRIKAKNIRSNLAMDEISKKLSELIRQNDFYKNAKNVMIFYPKEQEVDLRILLNDNKNFYLPRVNGDNLEICQYNIGDKLKQSDLGIMEPISAAIDINNIDLIILPALMADKDGYRLGYGGGYYDRLLRNKSASCKTIIPLPQELITEKLPHEKHDIKSDLIICYVNNCKVM